MPIYNYRLCHLYASKKRGAKEKAVYFKFNTFSPTDKICNSSLLIDVNQKVQFDKHKGSNAEKVKRGGLG